MVSEIFRTYVAGILSPTSFLGLLLLLSCLLLFQRKYKAGTILVAFSTLLFILITTAPLRYAAFSFLEVEPEEVPRDFDYVVVLAARIFPNDKHPLSSQLSPALLSRMVYGIELTLGNPKAKLILTGNGAGGVPEAKLMEELAWKLGLPKSRVIAETESMNTKDHPKYLAPLLRGKKFVLVTSSYHMRRTLKNFRAHNLEGYPAPTDFRNKSSDGLNAGSLIMRGENLSALDRWMTEMYSTIWTYIRMSFFTEVTYE